MAMAFMQCRSASLQAAAVWCEVHTRPCMSPSARPGACQLRLLLSAAFADRDSKQYCSRVTCLPGRRQQCTSRHCVSVCSNLVLSSSAAATATGRLRCHIAVDSKSHVLLERFTFDCSIKVINIEQSNVTIPHLRCDTFASFRLISCKAPVFSPAFAALLQITSVNRLGRTRTRRRTATDGGVSCQAWLDASIVRVQMLSAVCSN
jgi:hypothetical protein